MAFPITVDFGRGIKAAPPIVALGVEMDAFYGKPMHARFGGGLFLPINSGQIGNYAHQIEKSRHNPAYAPGGIAYICALDVSGANAATYQALAEFHRACWIARLIRIYRYGFSQRGDGTGLSWVDGSWKRTDRDQGHCHFDITMLHSYITVTDDFVPAWLDGSYWGLAEFLTTGSLQPGALGGLTMSEVQEVQAYVDQSMRNNVLPLYPRLDQIVAWLAGGNATNPITADADGTCWVANGAGRSWISWITYHLVGEPVPRHLPASHPFWALPVVGQAPGDLTLEAAGSAAKPGMAIFLVQGGFRYHIDMDLWTRFGKKAPTMNPDLLSKTIEVSL